MGRVVITAITGVALAASAALAQDQRDVSVESFDRIDATGGYRLVVTMGDSDSVRLVGDESDFGKLDVDVRNGELRIDQDGGFFRRTHNIDVVVEVTARSLDVIDIGRGLDAEVNGLQNDSINVDVSTGARLELAGSCDHMDADVSTGAVLAASDLDCRSVEISGSTGASARVAASEALVGRASTGADIRVRGNPTMRDTRSSLGGDVRVSRSR